MLPLMILPFTLSAGHAAADTLDAMMLSFHADAAIYISCHYYYAIAIIYA